MEFRTIMETNHEEWQFYSSDVTIYNLEKPVSNFSMKSWLKLENTKLINCQASKSPLA